MLHFLLGMIFGLLICYQFPNVIVRIHQRILWSQIPWTRKQFAWEISLVIILVGLTFSWKMRTIQFQLGAHLSLPSFDFTIFVRQTKWKEMKREKPKNLSRLLAFVSERPNIYILCAIISKRYHREMRTSLFVYFAVMGSECKRYIFARHEP